LLVFINVVSSLFEIVGSSKTSNKLTKQIPDHNKSILSNDMIYLD